MKIVVLERHSVGADVPVQYEHLGQVVYYHNTTTVQEVSERVRDAEIIVANKAPLREETLKNAKVVDESNLNMDYISVGLAVRLLNMEENREVEYRIVGSSESNPSKGMISDESPIGKHLIGKRLNDLVEIVIPKGTYHFKIIGISK